MQHSQEKPSVYSNEEVFLEGRGFLSMTQKGFCGGSVIKNLPALQEPQETWVQSLGREDPLEKEMTTHSSILS